MGVYSPFSIPSKKLGGNLIPFPISAFDDIEKVEEPFVLSQNLALRQPKLQPHQTTSAFASISFTWDDSPSPISSISSSFQDFCISILKIFLPSTLVNLFNHTFQTGGFCSFSKLFESLEEVQSNYAGCFQVTVNEA
jgi:hypothetical protein